MAAIKTRTRKMAKGSSFQPRHREQMYLRQLKDNSINGFYRAANFSNELIFEGHSYRFPTDKIDKAQMRDMFLFSMARKDARAYCANRKRVTVPKRYPTNEYNYKYRYFKEELIAVDIDHAYWRIAYLRGIISERTYNHGLNPDFKKIRLAALSTMGADKHYNLIKKGKLTEDIVILKGDDKLKACYRKIRHECFAIMQELKQMLGGQFLAYRTDCIYFRNTPKNVSMVSEYLESINMTYKLLTKVEMPTAQTVGISELGEAQSPTQQI